MEKEAKRTDEAQIDAEIRAIMNPETNENAEAPQHANQPKKKRRKRRMIILLIGAVLAAAVGVKFLAGGNKMPIVQTAQLAKGDIRETLSMTGPIEGTDSVDVTSNLHAKITELHVKEGDRVTAGETLLMRIDAAELEKQLEIAQGNYDLALANQKEKQKEAQRGYEKALQDLRAAQDTYQRNAQLAASGDIAAVELETAQNALEDARRAVSSYQTENGKVIPDETLGIQVRNAEIELSQLRDKMNETVITAPLSGIVTRVNTKVGQFADGTETNRTLLTIENLDELQMEIKVSEYSIGKVKPGQSVRITADILGDGNAVNGEVVSISPTGEEKGGGSTERVIPTKVRILDKDTKLIAGITAKAEIELDAHQNTYVVPISAVGQDESGNASMQFVVPDESKKGTGIIRVVPIKTGLESDLEVELAELPSLAAEMGKQGEAEKNQSGMPNLQYLPVYDTSLMDSTAVRMENGM